MDVAEERAAKAIHLLKTSTGELRDDAQLMVAAAQAQATLAVAGELRALREGLPEALRVALLDALGDDSHLDRLARAIRELPDAIQFAMSEGFRR